MIGEFDLIKKLIPLLPINEATRIGAGDDCSVLELGIPDRQLIFKTDAVVENVHFTREASWERIGCKAISRCLSDMAAMAGNPISALITLGIPQDFLEEDVLKIYEGLIRRAKTFGVSISGGETVKVEKSVFLSVSMVGWIRKNRLCLRSHVQPGDALFVTGELGGSILGKHLDFVPRVKEAQWLAEHFDIHAMIDLSDGLSGDLRRLIEASGIGVHLLKESIPVSKEAKLLAKERGTHPLNHALNDGEDFVTPEAIMTYSREGEDEAALNFHAFVNRYIIRGVWKDRERPILINSWETSYFDLSEEKLLALADQASSLGFELFVLDDGWFSSRRDDKRGLGDWYVSKEVFPHGLASFSRKIKSKGLMFGLWVEPEMVNQDSDLYRRHPEWVVSIPGRTPCVTRHQYLLDLSHPDVRAYLFDVLSEVFTQADVDYVKWDFNRTITDYYSLNPEMNCMGEFMHRYILGLYELLGRITTRFENVLFESCASGGNRYDLGMLTFMPQTWTSDNTDLYHRISIQQGTLRGFPPSTMACHVSASPAHQSLRQSLIESRFDVACFGVLGYELDLKTLGALELEAVRGQISFYKRYRRIFQFGQFRPLKSTNPYSHWWSISLDDITIVLEFVYRNMPNTGRCDRLIIPYLKKDRRYRVFSRKMRIPKEFFGSLYPGYGRQESEEYSILVSGDILSSSGIALPPQFMGNGVSPLMRVIGDNGSRMYVIEEIREKASS